MNPTNSPQGTNSSSSPYSSLPPVTATSGSPGPTIYGSEHYETYDNPPRSKWKRFKRKTKIVFENFAKTFVKTARDVAELVSMGELQQKNLLRTWASDTATDSAEATPGTSPPTSRTITPSKSSATTQSSNNDPFPFLALPPELQGKIFETLSRNPNSYQDVGNFALASKYTYSLFKSGGPIIISHTLDRDITLLSFVLSLSSKRLHSTGSHSVFRILADFNERRAGTAKTHVQRAFNKEVEDVKKKVRETVYWGAKINRVLDDSGSGAKSLYSGHFPNFRALLHASIFALIVNHIKSDPRCLQHLHYGHQGEQFCKTGLRKLVRYIGVEYNVFLGVGVEREWEIRYLGAVTMVVCGMDGEARRMWAEGRLADCHKYTRVKYRAWLDEEEKEKKRREVMRRRTV